MRRSSSGKITLQVTSHKIRRPMKSLQKYLVEGPLDSITFRVMDMCENILLFAFPIL